MSKGNGWVPIDKLLGQEFKYINRPFSRIEAMFSHTIDIDAGKSWSVKGYAQLWQWSRNKVRKFIKEIGTPEGHQRDTIRTPYGHPIHLIDKGLWGDKDTIGTSEGHQKDTQPTPTINPNPNPNKTTLSFNGEFKEIVSFLNDKANKSFRHNSEKTKTLIKARLNEGFTVDDFKSVIEIKSRMWAEDENMNKFLRPETLFGTKFESYLNEIPKQKGGW